MRRVAPPMRSVRELVDSLYEDDKLALRDRYAICLNKCGVSEADYHNYPLL